MRCATGKQSLEKIQSIRDRGRSWTTHRLDGGIEILSSPENHLLEQDRRSELAERRVSLREGGESRLVIEEVGDDREKDLEWERLEDGRGEISRWQR
jgi:hypothetical protein